MSWGNDSGFIRGAAIWAVQGLGHSLYQKLVTWLISPPPPHRARFSWQPVVCIRPLEFKSLSLILQSYQFYLPVEVKHREIPPFILAATFSCSVTSFLPNPSFPKRLAIFFIILLLLTLYLCKSICYSFSWRLYISLSFPILVFLIISLPPSFYFSFIF